MNIGNKYQWLVCLVMMPCCAIAQGQEKLSDNQQLEFEISKGVSQFRPALDIKNNEIGEVIEGNVSISTKEANTELLVNDGDTVVIGGIYKVSRTEGESGVPGLRSIPLLGWLFKTGRTSETKNELLIFLSPRIIQLEYKGDSVGG